MSNAIQTWEFNLHPIRGLCRDSGPWFVAEDMAVAFNFLYPDQAILMFCKRLEPYTQHLMTGDRQIAIIPLGDVEALASNSMLPNKRAFMEWVYKSMVPGLAAPKPWVLDGMESGGPIPPPCPMGDSGVAFALVSLQAGEAFTTTLAIAQGTENDHASVIRIVRTYLTDLKEFGEVRFQIRLNPQGSPTEFALLTEPQATLLLTYMRNGEIVRTFKKRLVKAFWELTRKPGPQVPQTLSEALRLALDLEDRRAALEGQVQVLTPKAAFHDAVAITTNARTIEEVAKAFGSGLVRFYEWLRGEKIMLRNNREHLPYQEFLDRGYFEVKEGTYEVRAKNGKMEKRTYLKTMVTGKGQLWLHKRFTKQVEA